MKLLKEILYNKAVNLQGRMVLRKAVRGIIIKNQKLLMVYSKKNGDYKFPGGGINSGESREKALKREVQEEIGMQVVKIFKPYGKVIEYDIPLEKEYDVFKMISYYYPCKVGHRRGKQNLDQYEKDLGFLPVWIEINSAINTNVSLLRDGKKLTPRWVKRDLEVLEMLKAEIIAKELEFE